MTEGRSWTGPRMRSLIEPDGTLRVYLERAIEAEPEKDELIVELCFAPINPSDIGTMLGPLRLDSLRNEGSGDGICLVGQIEATALASVRGRLGIKMRVGLEGAGIVVAAGKTNEDLIGRKVGVFNAGTYARYHRVLRKDCMVLPETIDIRDGASWFVNPLTALGMTEVMRRTGHKALVHTAAASTLGQMLNRICREDDIGLVNIVRSEQQAALLRNIGAKWICDSSRLGFDDQLVDAVADTGATLAFDAVGGGSMAGRILSAMEVAISRSDSPFSRYGSQVLKQVYIYGGLDRSPTTIDRTFGMAWSIGGWLLTPFLDSLGSTDVERLRTRVADGLTSTFASRYDHVLRLDEALDADQVRRFASRSTGNKTLIALHGQQRE